MELEINAVLEELVQINTKTNVDLAVARAALRAKDSEIADLTAVIEGLQDELRTREVQEQFEFDEARG